MRQKIMNYIRAGYPGLFVVSHEETRIEAELQTVAKQLIVINNSRLTVNCEASWLANLRPPVSGVRQIVLPTGEQARVLVQLKLPADLAPGDYQLGAAFNFGTGERQDDYFSFQVIPRQEPPRLASKIALFDPHVFELAGCKPCATSKPKQMSNFEF